MILVLAYIIFITDNIVREVIRYQKKAPVFNTRKQDKYSSYLTIFFIYFVLVIPLLQPYLPLYEIPSLVRILGLFVSFLGMMIHLASIMTLGKYYSGMLQTSKNQKIIKTGLYHRIRHPGYLGMMLLSCGFGLAIGNWSIFLAILILFILIYRYRIHVEESMLRESFGEEYEEYARHTKRLIPFVW